MKFGNLKGIIMWIKTHHLTAIIYVAFWKNEFNFKKIIFKKWVKCINTSPTNSSLQNKFIQKKNLKNNYDIRPPQKKKVSSHVQSICDEASVKIFGLFFLFFILF